MHYMGVIIVNPPTIGNSIKQQLDRMLAPFDSDPEDEAIVIRKPRVCYCANHRAEKDAEQYAVEKVGFKSWKEMSDAADAEKPINPYAKAIFGGHSTKEDKRKFWEFDQEDLKNRWHKKYYYPYKFYKHEFLITCGYPLEPKSDCETCNGTGYYPSFGRWDWWVIGGRYDGEILMAPREHDDDAPTFGAEYYKQRCEKHLLEHNLIAVDDIAPGFAACSILGPDANGGGVWVIDREDFDASKAFELGFEKYCDPDLVEKAWETAFQNALKPYKGRGLLAVGIDYHN